MAQRPDWPVAERTLLAFIPFRDNLPDQTILRVRLDLLQVFLPAVLAPRPAQALTQPKRRLVEECAERGFACGDTNGSSFVRLRTG